MVAAHNIKARKPFFYLDKLPVEAEVERHYFGSEHGKSESDGITGLISKKVGDAIRSRNHTINNGKDMHTFLSNNTKKKDYVFKLITESDFEPIKHAFDGVNVKTLSGNCTRSLHQIKPDKKKGFYLTRPFSCFCDNCISGNFDHCTNKDFTLRGFTLRKLPTNVINVDKDVEEEEEDNENNHIVEEDEYIPEEIRVEQEDINFHDLTVGCFLISTVTGDNDHSENFVAVINEIKNEEEIFVEFLKQNYNVPNVFGKHPQEENWNSEISLDDIIMLIPKPTTMRRNRYIFESEIHLNR